MERRDFVRRLSAAGLLSVLDPAYVSAKQGLQSGKTPSGAVPQRPYGRTQDVISIIGFGGITVKDVTPAEASHYVSEAVDRGINYFDVATYGNAQERLGPALQPYRDKCFLACKTTRRDAAGCRPSWKNRSGCCRRIAWICISCTPSRRLMMCNKPLPVTGPWRRSGKPRTRAKSATSAFRHSQEAAHAALDRYDFDSILFPLSFPTWIKEGFGPSVHKRAHEANRGILALKAIAHQKWPQSRRANTGGTRRGTSRLTTWTRCRWGCGSLCICRCTPWSRPATGSC